LRTQNAFYVPHGLNPLGYHSATLERDVQHGLVVRDEHQLAVLQRRERLSYLSQMIGLTVQNWLSAGVGIVVAVALVRGIIGRSGKSLGNFWQDSVARSSTCWRRFSVLGAIVLVSQGVIANFSNY